MTWSRQPASAPLIAVVIALGTLITAIAYGAWWAVQTLVGTFGGPI